MDEGCVCADNEQKGGTPEKDKKGKKGSSRSWVSSALATLYPLPLQDQRA